MNELLKFGKESLPSVIKNPFAKNRIEGIHVHFYPFDQRANAQVEFMNGDTKGTQNFQDSTFDGVVLKIKALIEQLEIK